MKPLPKCAGECYGYYTTAGNLVGAETSNGKWVLIDETWHHIEPISIMPHGVSVDRSIGPK